MPIWSASWVLPAGFKGARDARYAMWVSMLSMWGCRVVVGYVLGIMLGWGVVGVWMGMFADYSTSQSGTVKLAKCAKSFANLAKV